jgi:RNA polymerase sigma-70 factor (ECF subfamily)
MASEAQTEPNPDLLGALAAAYGFVPNLFQAQTVVPAAIQAESGLMTAIGSASPNLTSAEKNAILATVGTAQGNRYVAALYRKDDQAVISRSVARFGAKLASYGPYVSKNDVESLRGDGLRDSVILEVVATVALGNMLCVLAKALNPKIDNELNSGTLSSFCENDGPWNANFGPYLNAETSIPNDLASLLRDQYGFVPGLFQSQASWPDLLAAEIKALELLVFSDEHLTRLQKECILLAVSVANLNTYGVALHSQVLSLFGVPTQTIDGIVHAREDSLAEKADRVLLSEVTQLIGFKVQEYAGFDQKGLSDAGFSQLQVLEAIVVAALGTFFNTLAFGLGSPPDFPLKRVFTEKDLYPSGGVIRPTSEARVRPDPDAEFVARVQGGETDAFEELVRRNTRRVFGTLNGMLGNYDEARDATQDVFVKAFEHIGRFEGRSKFSTWVTSIAVNTGTEILRQRKSLLSLDDEEGEQFRPRKVTAWAENPEALFAAAQMNSLVREAVQRLPHKYRVAVLLRDINQLSTEDAAETLGLSVPALKARVLRGRLMLRESLAAHFVSSENANA